MVAEGRRQRKRVSDRALALKRLKALKRRQRLLQLANQRKKKLISNLRRRQRIVRTMLQRRPKRKRTPQRKAEFDLKRQVANLQVLQDPEKSIKKFRVNLQ